MLDFLSAREYQGRSIAGPAGRTSGNLSVRITSSVPTYGGVFQRLVGLGVLHLKFSTIRDRFFNVLYFHGRARG